jgi:hypothetical protein
VRLGVCAFAARTRAITRRTLLERTQTRPTPRRVLGRGAKARRLRVCGANARRRTEADATDATTSVASRREPHAHVAGLSPRTCRALRGSVAKNCSHAMLAQASHSDAMLVPGELFAHDVGVPCPWLRDAVEHGRRAREPDGERPRLRECARQDRGESRAHGPRGHARTRRAPRRLLGCGANQSDHASDPSSNERRRDGRHDVCGLTARTTRTRRGPLPSDLPGASRFGREELLARDARPGEPLGRDARPRRAVRTRRWGAMPVVASRSRARSPST